MIQFPKINAPVAPTTARRAHKSPVPDQMIRDDRGRIIANIANVLTFLRSDERVIRCFAYDEMLAITMLMTPLPVQGGGIVNEASPERPFRDTDATQLQEYLQREGIPKIGKDQVFSAVDLRAQECGFHPVRDYLDGLKWDGVSRIAGLFPDYFGAKPSSYSCAIGKMFLIGMVARIYGPGCKADYMPVVEAAQGARKSSACKILGGQWFSDSLPDVAGGKDVSAHLNGKWLIEIAEMSAMSRAEDAALKAFITRTDERYRPSYGRKEVLQPRQCVFIGTINKTNYLRDETGGRRYWPVAAGRIETDALSRDRDQLFAEAVVLYREGVKWWPESNFEIEHIKPQQEARFERDAWQDTIGPWLVGKAKTTVTDVARLALSMETSRIGTVDQRRIIAILERLGWTREGKNPAGRTSYGKPKPT